jgi:hypothetical protein
MPPQYKDCTSVEIAQALREKPFKILTTLEDLSKQHRVEQRGKVDWWCIPGA